MLNDMRQNQGMIDNDNIITRQNELQVSNGHTYKNSILHLY